MSKMIKTSLSAQVLREVETYIKNGTWKVGEKIPPEPELVELFGVSRNTVREAVQSLIHAGVLEAKQGDGTYVVADDRFDAALSLRLENSDIREILEVRCLIEKEVVRKACQKVNGKEIETLAAYLEKRNQTYEDQQLAVETDMEFHLYIADMASGDLLFDLYKSLWGYVSKVTELYFRETKAHTENEFHNEQNDLHYQLYEAIKNGNEAKAVEIVIILIDVDKKILTKMH